MQYIWLKYYTYPDHPQLQVFVRVGLHMHYFVHIKQMMDIKLLVYVIVIIDMIYLRM